jgi:hypothetical protein
MTASTAYGAVMFAGLAVITVMCVAAVIARAATHALVTLDRHDAQAAADHNEPSRAEVEAGWLDEMGEVWNIGSPVSSETPIFDGLQREDFMASVLADIDQLPGVRHG